MAKSTQKPNTDNKSYVFALNHEMIYADKILKFGIGPSVCKLEIGNESNAKKWNADEADASQHG